MPRSTICLNMIVKNESHIILKTLKNLVDKIKLDYWVIGDNGSTDGTQDIIRNFFKEQKIPGELYQDEWHDFGHNRTKALAKAYNKTDYVFVFDADDELCGNINIPARLNLDGYHLIIMAGSTKYVRKCLVNNRKKWKYVGVLHEYIDCIDKEDSVGDIVGDYYIQSNRLGARSQNPDKYLHDALVLEKAYYKAILEKDGISNRYVFYCANSYKDAGKPDEAITWYEKTLESQGWIQERYISCLNLFEMYSKNSQIKIGYYYLVKAFTYDNTRVEAILELVKHYCCENMNEIAYAYYLLVSKSFESTVLTAHLNDKLFVRTHDYYFYLPYYMIIVCERLKKHDKGIKMYEIIFEKQVEVDKWWTNNLLFNLQFFIDKIDKVKHPKFWEQCEAYINVLIARNAPIDIDLINKFANGGLNKKNLKGLNQPNDLSEEDINNCKSSKKILFYVGFSNLEWNVTYGKTHALGGSERAVLYLTQHFPKDYEIYVGGVVGEEKVDNVTFVNLGNLKKLITDNHFHTIIISRYIAFFEMFSYFKSKNVYIWAHDTHLLPYGCNLTQVEILKKWDSKINKCICLTEWHRSIFLSQYPTLIDKISLINNGIDTSLFPPITNKVKNSFIYSSRPERGLTRILELWPEICERIPGASLSIAMYGDFPANDSEKAQMEIIQKYPNNIMYLGKLSQTELYNHMSTSEYWLYPNCYDETSCITALEMLHNKVICVYYPKAGLVNTIGDYGVTVENGNEIQSILDLTDEKKTSLITNGYEYTKQCSWANRAEAWAISLDIYKPTVEHIKYTVDKWVIYINTQWIKSLIFDDYINSLKTKYNIEWTHDLNYILSNQFSKISFLINIFDDALVSQFKVNNPEVEISVVSSEPLNLAYRLKKITDIHKKFPDIKIYDYSLSNIKILNEQGIMNTEQLPYLYNEKEVSFLKNVYSTEKKIYDFGFLNAEGTTTESILTVRRQTLIQSLIDKGFTVHIISGWGESRDIELAKCNIILNIHGQLFAGDTTPINTCKIFEHIRCNRLLYAGFKILSEESYCLDTAFINSFSNLKLIKYDDFFNINRTEYNCMIKEFYEYTINI